MDNPGHPYLLTVTLATKLLPVVVNMQWFTNFVFVHQLALSSFNGCANCTVGPKGLMTIMISIESCVFTCTTFCVQYCVP